MICGAASVTPNASAGKTSVMRLMYRICIWEELKMQVKN